MFGREKDPEKAAAAAAEREEKSRAREAAKAKQREESAARREERSKARAAAAEKARMNKLALKGWRVDHPAETTLNKAASLRSWPTSERGVTKLGPVKGGHAEFINAGAHKAWTATRLVAGAATAGMSALATGRKNKGAAMISVTFGNGAAQTYEVKPDKAVLVAANAYVNAFNALAAQLERED